MNRRFVSLAAVLLLVSPLVAAQEAVPASAANDDFESGTLANWRTHIIGEGGWFIYSDGKTPPEPSKTDPFYPFEAPDPPQGRFAAISDTNGFGTRILYQDVALDGRYRLTLSVFYVNEGRFTEAATSGPAALEDSQTYRIDLISPAASITSLAREDILATIFQGRPTDPARQAPTELTRDLSLWAGQTIRLRIVSSDNEGPLRAGVDDIRFQRSD